MSLLVLLIAQSTVSVASLLPQMTDLTLLSRPANPPYRMAQASSYDRHSNLGPNRDEFANGDAGQFVRIETVGDHKEYVLADLKGPGAVVRFWSANPAGTVRFYFDGESKPRLEAKLLDLLTGQIKPFVDPFAYMSARGTNLYFPFPYQKSLKITVDDSDKDGAKYLYYQVGYRTYDRGVATETFDPAGLPALDSAIRRVGHDLIRPGITVPRNLQSMSKKGHVSSGGSLLAIPTGSGTVRSFEVKIPFPLVQNVRAMDWTDAYQPHNVLRSLMLKVTTDDHLTINTPLGDFFSTAPGINVDENLPFTISVDGTMVCRLPMPFKKNFRLEIENLGPVDVPLSYKILIDPTPPPANSYALHAQWQAYRGPSQPFRNLPFLVAKGEGNWVGSNLHVTNSTPAWWGEGDEKVTVDGEKFPSTFGTGTEDYYGYAWCDPTPFHRPYHSQPRADGPGNFGQTQVKRWHVIDPIPYRKSINFDMELWHWQNVDTTFAFVTYWYAPANSQGPVEINRSLLLTPELVANKPVEGALEGENMKFGATGGKTSLQAGFWELSGDKQIWWTEPVAGDKLTIEFPVKEAGTYEVFGNFCQAKDYGIHSLSINGSAGQTIDFFGPGVTWKKLSLGTFTLPAGTSTLEVTCKGKRAEAVDGQMFGLDYLLLEKK